VRDATGASSLMRERSLKVNVIWAVIGNGISAFSLWVLLVYLAKVATVETVGIFAIAQAVGLPVSSLLSLKVQRVQVTDARNEYTFGEYLALKIVLCALIVVATAVAGFWFYAPETALVTAALGIGYAVIELRETFMATMQKAERMDQTAISRTLQGLSSLVFFVAFHWVTGSLMWGILGMVVSRTGVLLFYDMPVSKRLLVVEAVENPAVDSRIVPHWHWGVLWRLALLSAPLGLVGWFGTLFTSVPRLVLDKYAGTKEVGYFAAISSLLVVGNLMTNAVGQTVLPRLAKYFDHNRPAFKLLLGKLLAAAVGIGLLGVVASALLGRQILTLLFKPDYAEHSDVFVSLMVAGCGLFVFSWANTALTAAQRYAVQLPLYGLAALAAIVSAYLLIPRYGMMGAAWSLTICYVVGVAGCTLILVLAMRVHPAPQPAL
jgi:O-antigen/teichoic acid export membrane protein